MTITNELQRALHEAEFTNSFVDELPGEAAGPNHSRQVPGYCYSRVQPTPVSDPRLLAWSREFGDYLGLKQPSERGLDVDILGGSGVASSMKPYAARYGGHQFGSWAGQLGDGRAISLGEVAATDGSRWEVQLKGAGPTPYSRRADGRAVLRSSIREFLCSEAMHWLGVPTTRALSLVETGDTVIRDMFYLGDPRPERGAIVARVAPSFIRFGNFEMMTSLGELDNLRALADYVIRNHYPGLGEPSEAVYAQWFQEICRRTAVMIAHWMTVGFVHGVMNTDNMSILGLTIDYGPYGWLEPYEPGWTPNTTDFSTYRYAFGEQPHVGLWNLAMLARALSPLIPKVPELEAGLDLYRSALVETHHGSMRRKLGLTSAGVGEDESLFQNLDEALIAARVDMTLFYRTLSHRVPELLAGTDGDEQAFQAVLDASAYADLSGDYGKLREWLPQYVQRLQCEKRPAEEIRQGMLQANPKYVLRNYLAQIAIEAADVGNLAPLHRLMHVLRHPYDEQPEHEDLAAKRPDWARNKPGCSTLSCSS